jgi:hypothetical protein
MMTTFAGMCNPRSLQFEHLPILVRECSGCCAGLRNNLKALDIRHL